MEIGMVGLGRMGGNMARRLMRGGHSVVAYDRSRVARMEVVAEGATEASSIKRLLERLQPPRAVWLMVPSGAPTDAVIRALASGMEKGDIIIDGGNSNYHDSSTRAAEVGRKGVHLLDVGTSGGVRGLENGYCMTVGGDAAAFKRMKPVFDTLAPAPGRGYVHAGPSGAGHFVKMVHNGIEYGLMEAYAEGFELLHAKSEYRLNLPQIAEVWRHGSVVRSWLLDLAAEALKEDPTLAGLQAFVEDSGEGRWTVNEAIALGVPVPVISLALQARFRSRQYQPFGGRLLAALRREFGGHPVRQSGQG